MKDCARLDKQRFFDLAFLLVAISLIVALSGCGSQKTAQPEGGPHRYSLTGRVVSVDKDKQQVEVDGDDIPGFMMAMTMGYAVKNPSLLDSISPEDKIKADVVVNNNDVWLENIVVTKKGEPSKSPSSATPPAPATSQSK